MSGLRNYVMIIASIVIFASIIVETNADPIVPFLEVEPNGIESELFTGELEEHIINIYNSGDNAVEFSVTMSSAFLNVITGSAELAGNLKTGCQDLLEMTSKT